VGAVGVALGIASLAALGARGLVYCLSALSAVALFELVARRSASARKHDLTVIALTVLTAGSIAVAWAWPSLTSASHHSRAGAFRAAISEVFAELQYDWARTQSAAGNHQYLEATPLAISAYAKHEDALSETLPFHVASSVYAFYTFAREVDADPSGLVGTDANRNFRAMQRALEHARAALAPYVE
jgi:hypothetical protein